MASFVGHFYFSPRGRTGRQAYWLFGVLPLCLLGVAIGLTAANLRVPRDEFLVLLGLALPVALWMWIAIGSRRLHDIGLSAWWMALVLALPLVVASFLPERVAQVPGLVLMVLLGAVPGVRGSNKFGSDPNGSSSTGTPDEGVRPNTTLERSRER